MFKLVKKNKNIDFTIIIINQWQNGGYVVKHFIFIILLNIKLLI